MAETVPPGWNLVSSSCDHLHPDVTFTVSGGNLPQGGKTVNTNAQDQACVPELLLSSFGGDYTVTETIPTGYKADAPGTSRIVSVTTEANCSTSPDTDKAQANFSNTPLTNTTVSIDSQVNGGTASTIDCEPPVGNPPNPTPTEENGDGSLTLSDKEPGTCTCTIMVDP